MMFIAQGRKPTKPEKLLTKFLRKEISKGWKYTGNGSFRIDGKNPDFVFHKKKLIIEFDHTYWHSKKLKIDKARRAMFRKHGYFTISLNENDLKDLAFLKRKIQKFMHGKSNQT